ncbi:MAG: MMPL family transporter [Desulfobacterales bacterium]|nr:MAG: MMPL family transporter [Desulfobacterales bacterium]
MKVSSSLTRISVNQPKLIAGLMVLVAICLLALATLPSVSPDRFSKLNPLKVDTDPENMLPKNEAVRVFHDTMKHEMALYDMVILGVVNEAHPDGVFNPESLAKIYELTQYAKTLRWPDPKGSDKHIGVIEIDIIAPSTVENIEQAGPGTVTFEWLMASPPKTREEALAIRHKAERIPFLNGTLVSEDGKALCLYLPITSKDISYKIYSHLEKKIAEFSGDEQYHITGLPVAEDTFGVQMFKQMAITGPVAMVIIFLLMLFFFRKLTLIISPLIIAMVSVICTMSLLVISGKTVHIMSSMIPIFIVPIAVLDAVHILSEFFDRYQATKDRRKTITGVMDTLYTPMLYTSLTTAVGFASLALAPIPPVQVFGLFVAFGVLLAWILSVTFIPAFVMFIKEESLEKFGAVRTESKEAKGSLLGRLLARTGRMSYSHAKLILIITIIATLVAIYGITRININDNPIKWFSRSHPIRVADHVLNDHFGGTYMGYLALESKLAEQDPDQYVDASGKRLSARASELKQTIPSVPAVFDVLRKEALRLGKEAKTINDVIDQLESFVMSQQFSAPADQMEAWDEALLFLDQERQRSQVFKQPEVLSYIEDLQKHLLTTGVVGKSNSLADIVKTVYRELVSGEQQDFKIPDSVNAVAQTLITYQNSHRPQDLWHFVNPHYTKSVIWTQLKSGDNQNMSKVVEDVDRYFASNPPPHSITHGWFGLTYINVIWQQKMVVGMLRAFLGSFLFVFVMMSLLYRSSLWGMLCMIPLTVTITFVYGAIGLMGKDYDMPVAVLSSLSLGLAVDYAIHFLSRSRQIYEDRGSWAETIGPTFGEPARAITRNVFVVGMGFLPLLLAPLVPYQTVGIFVASILFAAGTATLLIIPSPMTLLQQWLFPEVEARAFACKCITCSVTGAAAVALVAINVYQFLNMGWTSLTWISLGVIAVLTGACTIMGRGQKCRIRTIVNPNVANVEDAAGPRRQG